MRKLLLAGVLGALLTAGVGDCLAGEKKTSIGGKAYLDYFINMTDLEDDDLTPRNGFQLRRGYFTVKQSWDDLMFRFTTDIDYKYGSGNLNVYTKYAYLQWSGIMPGTKLILGQHGPGSHGWVDDRWHYRSVAKSMTDELKWTSSAELGAALKGTCPRTDLDFIFSLNNGNGYKKPVRKDGIGLVARLAWRATEEVVVSGLFTTNTEGTWDDGGAVAGSDEADTYIEGLAGYENDRFALYGQYGLFNEGDTDIDGQGISLFGRVSVHEKTWLFGRVDLIDEDKDADDDAYNVIIAGLDYAPAKGLYVQPNVRIVSYEDDTDSETVAALTVYTKF